MRSSRAIWAWSTPWEEARPASVACLSPSSPRTLTNTRAWRRSGLVSTAVTVTNPMRGSFSPSARRPESTSRTASFTLRMRSEGILAIQEVFARHKNSFHSNPVGKHPHDITLQTGRGVRERSRVAPDQRRGDRGALPEVVMVGLRNGGAEAPLQLGLERLELLALALEAAVVREVDVDLQQTDEAHSRCSLVTRD